MKGKGKKKSSKRGDAISVFNEMRGSRGNLRRRGSSWCCEMMPYRAKLGLPTAVEAWSTSVLLNAKMKALQLTYDAGLEKQKRDEYWVSRVERDLYFTTWGVDVIHYQYYWQVCVSQARVLQRCPPAACRQHPGSRNLFDLLER